MASTLFDFTLHLTVAATTLTEARGIAQATAKHAGMDTHNRTLDMEYGQAMLAHHIRRHWQGPMPAQLEAMLAQAPHAIPTDLWSPSPW